MTTDLPTLPGIGSGLAAELRAAGVRDAEALRTLGADEAARRVAELGMRDHERTRRVLAEAIGETTVNPQVLGVHSVVFAVGDLDRAVEHYTVALGLPVTERQPDPPAVRFGLGPGAPALLLREDRDVPEATATARSPRVWVTVSDAAAAAALLPAAGPESTAGTGRVVEVADPWGNVVGFTDGSDGG